MKFKRAATICENIESNQFSEEEKCLAIYTVMNTHIQNGITKATLNGVIKWLWALIFELEEEKPKTTE